MADLQAVNTILCLSCNNHRQGINHLPREVTCAVGFRVSGNAFRIAPPLWGVNEEGENKIMNRGTSCAYFNDSKGMRQYAGEYVQTQSIVGLPEFPPYTIDSDSLSKIDSEYMEYSESM